MLADRERRLAEAAPFADSGLGVTSGPDSCTFLPVPPTGRAHVPNVDGLPPTLTVSSTGDPATPYEAGVELAKVLKGGLLTVEGYQHTAAMGGNPCVDEIVATYLVDLALPPDGARCTAERGGR